MQKSYGMNYAPKGKPSPVVKPGEFIIAAVALDQNLTRFNASVIDYERMEEQVRKTAEKLHSVGVW